jgi:hypothetical protein
MTAAKQPTYPEVSQQIFPQQIFSISLGFCCDDLWFSNTGEYPSLSQYPHHHVVEHYWSDPTMILPDMKPPLLNRKKRKKSPLLHLPTSCRPAGAGQERAAGSFPLASRECNRAAILWFLSVPGGGCFTSVPAAPGLGLGGMDTGGGSACHLKATGRGMLVRKLAGKKSCTFLIPNPCQECSSLLERVVEPKEIVLYG